MNRARQSVWVTAVGLGIVAALTHGTFGAPSAEVERGARVPSGPVLLAAKWRKGQVIVYRSSTETETSRVEEGKQAVNDVGVTEMISRLKVDDTGPSNETRIRTAVTWMRSISRPEGKPERVFDSSIPDDHNEPFGRSQGLLLGEEITLVLGEDGRLQSVLGLEKLTQKMLGEMPADSAIARQLGPTFEKGLKAMAEETAGVADQGVQPRTKKALGEDWRSVQTKQHGLFGTVEMETTHTFKAIESYRGRTVARVVSAGRLRDFTPMSIDPPPKGEDQLLPHVFVSASDFRSESLIDVDRGLLVWSLTTATVSADSSIEVLGKRSRQKLTMKIRTVTEVVADACGE